MKILNRGAEAIIYTEKRDGNDVLVKERVEKQYRIKQLDGRLRKERTKAEASLLDKAARNNLPVPRVLDSEGFKITMEFLKGERLKDTLNQKKEAEIKLISKQIGSTLASLHASGIIHGDLTTSNMILDKNTVFLIDFGLGKNSQKIEDQATDLYLLYEALKSTHSDILETSWEAVLEGYKDYPKHKEVMKRLGEIAKRRRYKTD